MEDNQYTLSSGCVFFDLGVEHHANSPVKTEDCPVCSKTVTLNGSLDFVRSDEWWENLAKLEGDEDLISAGPAEFPESENPDSAILEGIRKIQEAAKAAMADPQFTDYPAHLRAGAFADDNPEVHAAYNKERPHEQKEEGGR